MGRPRTTRLVIGLHCGQSVWIGGSRVVYEGYRRGQASLRIEAPAGQVVLRGVHVTNIEAYRDAPHGPFRVQRLAELLDGTFDWVDIGYPRFGELIEFIQRAEQETGESRVVDSFGELVYEKEGSGV